MPRRRNPVPKVRFHAAKNAAVCDYRDPGTGRRRMAVLGPWGSRQAEDAYRALLDDLAAARTAAASPDVTVAEVCVRFLRHARGHYRHADGTPTSELNHYKGVVEVLAGAAGDLPAREFGPLALRRVRDAMVARGWARKWVNSQVGRVRRVFKWAAGVELVAADRWAALKAVEGLARGRTSARETDPVRPVPEADVEATLPHLPPPVAAMVRFQLLTGCRPQDAYNLRAADLDRSGPVWVYRPGRHKGAWRGRVREVFVGPRAQAVLGPWLAKAGDGYVFSPRRWVAEMHAARAACRTTRRYASHLRRNRERRVAEPRRVPGERYRVDTYRQAVARACRKAGVPVWAPNQLRHAAATRFRAEFGIELARVLLGHASAVTSEIYAEPDRRKAADAMTRVG